MPRSQHVAVGGGRRSVIYTIFEGTSEIQRLVIARAISGLHIP
jgi:acyl-CoA dehydrogenase